MPEPADLTKVFIAGTGRSGTTILNAVIGGHRDIQRVPVESKFIVEGDGLNALVPALSDQFSVTMADLALLRFMAMMGRPAEGAIGATDPAFGLGLRKRLGPENFDAALDRYLAELTDFPFSWDDRIGGTPYPKHFEDRGELVALTRAFIDALFATPAIAAGKTVWCEKTPSNLVAIDFLWELYPEALIVHVKRDPRGVVHSLMQQDWAPAGIGPATAFLRHILVRWSRLKPRLGLPDRRYIEVRLEDLCDRPQALMAEIAGVIGIEPDFGPLRFKRDQVDRWQTEMPDDHRRHVESALEDLFPVMGYQV